MNMGDVHVGSNDVTGHIIHYLHGILGRKICASGASNPYSTDENKNMSIISQV